MDGLNRYKGVIIFAAPRTGSTYLVEVISSVLSSNNPSSKIRNLYEMFEASSAFTREWQPITIDRYEWIPRPYTNGVLKQRIKCLCQSDIFPVMKIFMQDFEGQNYDLYDRHFSGDDYYKIILNRYNIEEQIISYLLSKYTNIWHVRDAATAEKFKLKRMNKMAVNLDDVRYIGKNIINLYAWQLFNDQMPAIWYEDLANLTIADLNIWPRDVEAAMNPQQKMNSNHVEQLHDLATNSDEVLRLINELTHSISKARDIVYARKM